MLDIKYRWFLLIRIIISVFFVGYKDSMVVL